MQHLIHKGVLAAFSIAVLTSSAFAQNKIEISPESARKEAKNAWKDIVNGFDCAGSPNVCKGDFVQRLLNKLASNNPGKYVMICAMHTQCNMVRPGANNVYTEETWSTTFMGDVNYGIWIWNGPAEFVHGGDGGWANWGFLGGTRSGPGGKRVVWN